MSNLDVENTKFIHEAVRNAYKILVGNLKGRDHSEDLGIDGRII
jgi:hypothetical protein